MAGWVFSEEKVEDIINNIQRERIAPLFETGGQSPISYLIKWDAILP